MTGDDEKAPTATMLTMPTVLQRRANITLRGASLAKLIAEYEQRTMGISEAVGREEIRQTILRETGGLDYDAISREFQRVRRELGWPDTATLKDFRHLFATCMQNSGMPERYIKYLLGHTQGREAIVHYAHLNQIRQHYEAALQSQMKPVIEALSTRLGILGL
jgi:integrase